MRSMKALMLCLLLLGAIGLANAWAAGAQAANGSPIARDFPPGLQIPDAARPGPHFDADKATEAYLDLLSPEQRKLSDDYFEGGYWLQLWDFLVGVAIAAFLLFSGISVRMRDLARRISRWRWLSTAIYVLFWLLAGFVLELPWAYYEGFVREHQYGLSTQDLGGWLGDALKGLLLAAVFLPPILSLLYALVRRLGARWWIWASAGSFVLFLFMMMAETVFIEPLFNDYQPLPDGPVRQAVLSLARANRIPTEHLDWFDASKQTTRVSANVSGFLGTTRVNLNDNLVNTTSLPEIRAVLGHEMGHYVLNHGLRLTIYLTLVFAIALYCVHRSLDWSLARWGGRLGLEGREDPAALPLAVIALSVFFFLATPLTNSIVRQAEAEADAFGLNAAREPNGFAMSAMRLSTYRKIRPSPLEEIVFYDHPSGYTRVHNAMLWLAENQDNPTANAPIAPPMQPLKFEKLNEPSRDR
ncbi:MAG TPA: M48 family metallopeptidase [Xanthomonadaceae bacterium]|jgi:STE24 endopeptidase|nr:M48 family metallopeptidase [Xanthomonadaceae bacterium]